MRRRCATSLSVRATDTVPALGTSRELVRAIRAAVESLPWREDLPRKFKISVSGCREACGRPWINDVGLVASPDGSFRVILAGSLGVKPDLGRLVYDSLPLEDILPLVVAVLRLFHAEGERTNRSRGRLVICGNDWARRLFGAAWTSFSEKRDGKAVGRAQLCVAWKPQSPRGRLCLPLGDIASDVVLEMVEAVGAAGGEVRLGMCHDLLIFAEAMPVLGPRLAALAARARWSRVPAQPGVRAASSIPAAACRIGRAWPGGCELLVGVTGCPNNCSQAATADIGLIGRLLPRSGREHVEGFRLYAGGGKGETPTLAEELHPGLPAEAAHEAVAWLAQEYRRAQDDHATSFADFVAASGDALRGELARRYDLLGRRNSSFRERDRESIQREAAMTTSTVLTPEQNVVERQVAATYLPLAIRAADLTCLIVGGGRIGTRKAITLCRGGAKVTVLSPEISPRLREFVDRGQIEWRQSPYAPSQIRGFRLVVAATADHRLNRQIGEDAEAEGILSCVVSAAGSSGVIFPAVYSEGDITVAVHSHGRNCRQSQAVRNRIAVWLASQERVPSDDNPSLHGEAFGGGDFLKRAHAPRRA